MPENNPAGVKKRRSASLFFRVLRIKKSRYITLAVLLTAPVIWLGTVADNLKKIAYLLPQAHQDANEIETIKRRIEGQAATIDLVAHKAAEVEALTAKASKSVSELELLTEFTTTVSAAQSDNRKAFDQLETWMGNPAYKYRDRAEQAWAVLLNQHAQLMVTEYSVPWKESIEPAKLSLAELIQGFETEPILETKIGVLQYIAKRGDISKSDRLRFYIGVMKREQSLNVLETAGRGFTSVADLNIKPLAVKYLLQWWAENRDNLKD